jgi:hypothetical protein
MMKHEVDKDAAGDGNAHTQPTVIRSSHAVTVAMSVIRVDRTIRQRAPLRWSTRSVNWANLIALIHQIEEIFANISPILWGVRSSS